MKPGPKKKPTKLRVLEGNPSKRALPKNEPKPKQKRPRCPSWLRDDAKTEWRRIVPKLDAIGLLTEVDGTALAGYCQAYAKWKEAEAWIEKRGMTYQLPKRDDVGNIVSVYVAQWPQVSIAHKSFEQVRKLCAEFGMTPSARGQMELPDRVQDDEMERLLGG